MTHITINFANVSWTSTNGSIQVNDGAFALGSSDGLNITGTIAFSAIDVTSGVIRFGTSPGSTFNGSVQVAMTSSGSGRPPSIQVINFTGSATVTWPTSTGPMTQQLASGDPLFLSGYVG